MTKKDESNEIKELTKANENLTKMVENLENEILDLKIKLEKSNNKDGRKSQVLELLRKYKTISILDISNHLGISTKNVSSQLTYLRSDGYAIFTDPNGRKMLVEEVKKEEVVEIEEVQES